jgi:hypothetical protein
MQPVDYLIFLPFSIWALWVGPMNLLNTLDTDILNRAGIVSRLRNRATASTN